MKTTWIFSAGMRRSSSTLQYHFARELVEFSGGYAAGWVTWQRFMEIYQAYDGKYPTVILKCHAFMPTLVPFTDTLFKNNRAKALTIFRDPRDVAVSMLSMLIKINFPQPWKQVLIDIPVTLGEFLSWASLPNEQHLVQSYGENTQQLLRGIANFLRISPSTDWEHDCLERHTLDAHRKLIEEYDGKWDDKNLFWYNHIDQGKIGRYKHELSAVQIEQIDALYNEWKKTL